MIAGLLVILGVLMLATGPLFMAWGFALYDERAFGIGWKTMAFAVPVLLLAVML